MSDEGDIADDAANDGGDSEDNRGAGGRTAVVTKSATRPQRPTGKRSRQRVADTDEGPEVQEGNESSDQVEVSAAGSATKKVKKGQKSEKAKKSKKSGDRSANPVVFIYSYLKQVVGEMRKVIWPNRKQMLTYTSVVLGFLAFMVALVGLADFGLTKLVLLVFG